MPEGARRRDSGGDRYGGQAPRKGNGGAEMITPPVSRSIDSRHRGLATAVGPHGGAGKLKLAEVYMSAEFDWKHGRPPRLRWHDYSARAAYFVTINVFGRDPLFGSIRGQDVVHNEYGVIAEEEWLRCKHLRSEVDLGAFVIMPDHLHGIVTLAPPAVTSGPSIEGSKSRGRALYRRPRSLGALVAGFKSSTTKRINLLRNSPGAAVWQRNYHEHVIRHDKELAAISEYIMSNPLKAARKGRS
jgi:putative transposase